MSKIDIQAQRESGLAPRPCVLVVEDESLVRMLVVQVLEEAGYAVSEAAEARTALLMVQSQSIDLIVADVGLPGLNGRQMAQQARALQPNLKVLFMTGYADSAILDAALPEGVDLITKPFDLDQLAAKAEALLAL
jgi:DNA-binding response OmpR family regulator